MILVDGLLFILILNLKSYIFKSKIIMKTRTIGEFVTPKNHPELKSKIWDMAEDFTGRELYITEDGCRYVETDLIPKS